MDADRMALTLGDLANANVEAPDPWVRMGAGLRDVIDPFQWAWLRLTDPAAAAAFGAQRADAQARYARGVASIGVDPQQPMGDIWRVVGAGLPFAAMPGGSTTMTPETAMSVMGAQQLNSGLISILRAMGMPDGVGQ